MRMISTLGMLFTASLAIGGCTTSETSADGLDPGETVDTAAADGKADGSSTIAEGAYSLSPDYSAYWALTLGASDTYTLRGGCKPNPVGPSCFAIIIDSGHYKLTKSGSNKYIRLYSDETECTTCSGSDELLVKFQYSVTSYGAKLTDTSDGDVYKATLPTAGQTVESEIGSQSISCASSGGDPATFTITASSAGSLAVSATDSRDASYSLDSSSVSSANALVLAVTNDVDGPLATDKLSLSMADIAALGAGTKASINGTDTYTEGYDGTTSHYTLKCKLK